MPPRARKPAGENAADQTPTEVPEKQAPRAEIPEDQAPPAETATTDEPESEYVQALRRERDGYLRYDRKDRAAAVDAELKRAGAKLRP